MFTKNTRLLVFLLVTTIVLVVIGTACGAAPEAQKVVETVVVEKEVEKVVEKEVKVIETVEVEKEVKVIETVVVEKAEEVLEPLPYGLTPGKPYDGAELNFLVCCPTAAQFALLNKLSQGEFYDLTGIKVIWGEVPFAEFQAKVIAEVTSASPNTDLIAYVDAWGPSLFAYLEPLDGYIERDGWDLDNYPAAYLKPGMGPEGARYGLPLRGHPFMFFYRQDIFAELGLEVPTTWAELEAAAEVIKEKKPDIYPLAAYYGINAGQNLFLWEALLWGNGSDILDENHKPIFNNEAGIEATRRYVSWLKKGYTSPGAVAFNEQEGNQEFNQGRAAMFMGWWWMYGRMVNCKDNPEEVCKNSGFAPTPGWEGKEAPTYGLIWPVGINKFSRQKEAAWEYMKFLLSEKTEKAVAVDVSDPAMINPVVVRMSLLQDEDVNATHNGIQRVGAEALQTARTQLLLPEWPEILTVLEVAINDVANGADVQGTMDKAAGDVEAIMERAGYYK
jgi:multiple sugar transport system substrate-binding protein